MTREEAIKVLTNLQNGHGVSYSESYGLCFGHTWMQAYEMAISALREPQIPCEPGDTVQKIRTDA